MSNQQWADPHGDVVDTFHLPSDEMPDPWRGCGFEDPGHSWSAGLAQRDRGFLGEGSNNDRFALGYYEGDDLPFTSRLARRFTTFDRYHCSLLSSTQSNRRYLHSGQSGGFNYNYIPLKEGGFKFDTIWDRLRRARVPVRSYFSDLPSLAFWGSRLNDMWTPVDRYFDDCRHGRLPAVTFIDPPYLPAWQADDHPHADPRAGQRFLRDVFAAFTRSPHWERGLFLLTYDEWGGFFDHVRPPLLPDDLAGLGADGFDYAQAGFRVPTVMASPYSRPGYVDHRTYDHTSIARFLEWRFLGAPPEGPGAGSAPWALSSRDRHANNIGASLGASGSDPDLFDLFDLPLPAPLPADCDSTDYVAPPVHATLRTLDGDLDDAAGRSDREWGTHAPRAGRRPARRPRARLLRPDRREHRAERDRRHLGRGRLGRLTAPAHGYAIDPPSNSWTRPPGVPGGSSSPVG